MPSSKSIPIVFIVDDDAAVRSALSLLVQSCGWRALACASGGDFFAALASAWPACIVVDPQLPDMDGSTLQREISRLRMNLPVIVITAYEDHPGTPRAVIDGAKAVIAKPFRGNELIAAIDRLVCPPGQRP
ncbi:MAG TPA: response regulator, partial [Gammaproteobacteria bacterium]|nr:response regulator [Gammaproteobacteria bacterium]